MMGFYADATDILQSETGVALIWLGAERVLSFRYSAEPSVLRGKTMPDGSRLLMSAQTPSAWLYGVLKQTGAGPRMSLTFRRLKSP